MNKMPVGGEAVFTGVLAHGRNADAIGKSDRPELEGREKRRSHRG